MEKLMRVTHDVKFSGQKSLRDSERVQRHAEQCNRGHYEQPPEGEIYEGRSEAMNKDEVDTRQDGTAHSQPCENGRTQRTVMRSAEFLPHGKVDSERAQGISKHHVEHLDSRGAPKQEVDPGRETARDDADNSAVVQSAEDPTHIHGMAMHCMVEGGREEADEHTQEEDSKCELLTERHRMSTQKAETCAGEHECTD